MPECNSRCFRVCAFSVCWDFCCFLGCEVWCGVQLEEVSSIRVHTGQHATLPQKHQPAMMFSALPPDAAMATLSIGSPASVRTPEDSSRALAGPRHNTSGSDQWGSVAPSPPAAPTPATAAGVRVPASTQGAAMAPSEAATLAATIAARHRGSTSIQGPTAALSEAASCTRSANAQSLVSTAADGDSLTNGSST